MAGKSRHNPLTSEAEAFRWVIVIAAGAATIIAVARLVAPLVAAIWGLLLVTSGVVFLWRDFSRSATSSKQVTRGGDGRHRVLVLANQTVRSPALLEAALAATANRASEILLVVPALVSGRAEPRSRGTDAAAEHARQRMELTLLDLKQNGRSVKGLVGDTEPSQALRTALVDFPADEVIVSTLPRERSHWLEQGVVERARIEIGIPIRHIVWDEAVTG